MSAVTYSNPDIQKMLVDFFVPVKVEGRSEPKIAQLFHVIATPTYVVLDHALKFHHNISGFYPPEAFAQRLRFLRAIVDLNNRKYDEAIDLLSKVVQETFEEDITPEALYELGVARYKKTGDFTDAVREWRKIQIQFPKSVWLKKVEYAL